MMLSNGPHDLRGRHIFLTGGTGCVGRTLLDYLACCEAAYGGLRVSVLTRNAQAFRARYPVQKQYLWLTTIDGSLSNLPDLAEDTTDVIHAAADTHLNIGYAAWIDQIVNGTRTLLDASFRAGVQRFLLVSSGAVYGPQPVSLSHINEDYRGAPDSLLPGSTYGQAKRVAEQLCTIAKHEHGLETVIARLFAFGSVHLPHDGRYALGSFVRDALACGSGPIKVAGDGSAVRSYLDGRAMAHALVVALVSGKAGSAYNVGSEEAVTIAELAKFVRDRLSPDREIVILGAADNTQRSRCVPDVSRIAKLGAASRSDLGAVVSDVAGARPLDKRYSADAPASG